MTVNDLAVYREKILDRATSLISRLSAIDREAEYTDIEKNAQVAEFPEAHAFAQPVRASQQGLLTMLWNQVTATQPSDFIDKLKASLWAKETTIRAKNRKLGPKVVREIATREHFRDNPNDIWKFLEIIEMPEDTISLFRQEYDDGSGLHLFFTDHHHQRLRSIRNAPAHEDEISYDLEEFPVWLYPTETYVRKFAIDKPLGASDFLESIAQTAIRARALHLFLENREHAPTADEIASFDDSLRFRLYHSDAEATAHSLLRMFAKLHWGPENFVLNTIELTNYHDLVERHGIVILQGPGALGKTALAHKLLYDYCNGHNSPYGEGEGVIEKYVPYSTKVGSDQMTMALGEGESPMRPTDETVTVFKTLLRELEGDEEATFYQRITGASRRLWVKIAQQYHEVGPEDTDEKIRELSLSIMKQKKVLLIIDNFEDLETWPHSLPPSERDSIRNERELIREWLQKLHDLGSQLSSRIIITTRGPGAAHNPHSPTKSIPGYARIVSKLTADDAMELFRKKIQARQNQSIDRGVKKQLGKHIRGLRDRKNRKNLREAFYDWTNDGLSHPAILIHAANTLETYDSLPECIEDWRSGNEQSDFIFDYCTRKMVATIGWTDPEREFITSLLSEYKTEDAFNTEQLEYNGNLLNNDKQKTQNFLGHLRLLGYILSTDLPRGITEYVWVPEYASAFRSIIVETIGSEMPKKMAAPVPAPSITIPSHTETQRQNNATLDNWEEWINGDPELSTEQRPEPPWMESKSSDDILKRVVRNTQRGLGFRKFEGYPDNYVSRVISYCDKTLQIFSKQMTSGSDFGLWGGGVRLGRGRVGTRTAASEVENMRRQERVDDAFSGVLAVYGAALSEMRKRERQATQISDSQVPEMSKKSLSHSHHRLSECIRAYYQYRPEEFSADFTDSTLSLMLSNAELAALITNSEPEFTTLMTQSAKIMKTTDINHREDSLIIPEDLKQHYKKWYRIYHSSMTRLDYQNISLMETFYGYLFWNSLRLWKEHPSAQGDYEEWESEEYTNLGKKLVDVKLSALAVDSHVSKARKSRVEHVFQRSFDDISMSASPQNFVNKGDYIQAKLGRHSSYSRQVGRHSEIRCPVIPGLDYPGTFLVKTDSVKDKIIFGQVQLDEKENPLTCREIPNRIYDEAKKFLASLDFSETIPRDKFLTKLQTEFGEEKLKILEWITRKKLHPVESMCEYSRGMPEILTIYHSLNFVGVDEAKLQSKEREMEPRYMAKFGDDAEIIYKYTSKSDSRRSVALPSHPKMLAIILERICEQAREVQGGGEIYHRTYEDLSKSWSKICFNDYQDYLHKDSIRTEPMCAQIFRMMAWGGGRKVRPTEQVDWSKIPSDPKVLTDEIRVEANHNVSHRVSHKQVDYPKNWRTIVDSYFEEVDSHCSAG